MTNTWLIIASQRLNEWSQEKLKNLKRWFPEGPRLTWEIYFRWKATIKTTILNFQWLWTMKQKSITLTHVISFKMCLITFLVMRKIKIFRTKCIKRKNCMWMIKMLPLSWPILWESLKSTIWVISLLLKRLAVKTYSIRGVEEWTDADT